MVSAGTECRADTVIMHYNVCGYVQLFKPEGERRLLILLDVFADMLDVEPAELQQAIRVGGEWEGLPLPAHQQLLGAMMMFDATEAAAFSRRWHDRAVPPKIGVIREPPVSLILFATQAKIAPLALYQAVTSGTKLRGIRPPVPISSVPPLMFELAAVKHFIEAYRGASEKK